MTIRSIAARQMNKVRLLCSLLLTLGAVACVPAIEAQNTNRLEISAQFQYVHTNAPPSGCGCFGLNGGFGSAAYYVTPQVGIAVLAGAVTNPNAEDAGHGITLTNYLAGPRCRGPLYRSRLTPFGGVLIGASIETGSVAGLDAGGGSRQTGFAAMTGGGVDLQLVSRLSLRLVQADYFVTTFKNGINDHQNNVSVSTGIVLRLGGHR